MSTETLPNTRSEVIHGSEVIITEPDLLLDGTTPLLLVNGYGAGPKDWGRLPGLLAIDRPVLAVEAVRPDDDGTMSASARNIVTIANELGITAFDLCGQSWGTRAAVKTASKNQDRVGKLVLIGATNGIPVIPPRYSALEAISTTHRDIEDAGKLFGGMIGELCGRDRSELFDDELAAVEAVTAMMNRPIDPTKIKLQGRALFNDVRLGHLHTLDLMGIQTPTLIVAGEKDPLTRKENAQFMSRVMPRSQLYIEPDVGHDVAISRVDKVSKVIRRFLESPAEPMNQFSSIFSMMCNSAFQYLDTIADLLPIRF